MESLALIGFILVVCAISVVLIRRGVLLHASRGSWGTTTLYDDLDLIREAEDGREIPAGLMEDLRLAQAPDRQQAVISRMAYEQIKRARERAKREQREAEWRQRQRDAEVRIRAEAWLRGEPPTQSTDNPWPGH